MQQQCIMCDCRENLKLANGIPICKQCQEYEAKYFKELNKNKKNFNPEISCIYEGKLYLGNYDQARLKDTLKEYGVTHILICAGDLERLHPDCFTYEQICVNDILEEDITSYIDISNKFIENSKCVFVHCQAGVSRSPSFVIAYVMWKEKISYGEAYDYVKGRRPIIFPNESFRLQLKEYEDLVNKQV